MITIYTCTYGRYRRYSCAAAVEPRTIYRRRDMSDDRRTECGIYARRGFCTASAGRGGRGRRGPLLDWFTAGAAEQQLHDINSIILCCGCTLDYRHRSII